MDITVKSFQGSYLVSGVEDGTTVAELKRMLHQQHSQAPEPDKQCLVFRHSMLTAADAAMQQLGIGHGDQLVMLPSQPSIKRQRAQTRPAADTAAIRAAITEEARRRGIEHTLKEERPPVARRSGLRLPADFLNASNEELMQLLHQALDGRMPPLPAGLQLTVGTGDAADEGAQEQEEELQVPEPAADRIAQLTDMGFSEALARNALLLHRGSVERGLEWLLEHVDDPAAAEPLSQERLRQVYGRRQGRTGVRLSIGGLRPEALLSQLTDMGFDAQAAQAVLSQVGPSLDLAVQMLLGGHPGRPRASSAGGAAAGAASAASSGGSRDPAQAQAQRSSQEGIEAQPAQAAAAATGAAGSAVAEAQPAERAATLSGGGAAAEASEAATSERWHSQQEGDPDEFEDGEDEEEAEDEDDEYDEAEEEEEFFDNEEDALYDLPLGGTVQLANLGSADIEQLLQGANLQELALGNQLLMPGGMDTVLAGPQSTLLRLLDSPAFLEQVAAGMQALEGTEQQQQQQGASQQAAQPSNQQPAEQQPQHDGAN